MKNTRRIVPLLFAIIALHASQAHAQRLDDIVLYVADSFARGDAKSVVSLVVRDGVSIDAGRRRIAVPMGQRQAAAVLRHLFDDRVTVSARPGAMQVVGGNPRRAFAEITWLTRAPNTTQLERSTIYLELVLNDERWQITQIRLLP